MKGRWPATHLKGPNIAYQRPKTRSPGS